VSCLLGLKTVAEGIAGRISEVKETTGGQFKQPHGQKEGSRIRLRFAPRCGVPACSRSFPADYLGFGVNPNRTRVPLADKSRPPTQSLAPFRSRSRAAGPDRWVLEQKQCPAVLTHARQWCAPGSGGFAGCSIYRLRQACGREGGAAGWQSCMMHCTEDVRAVAMRLRP